MTTGSTTCQKCGAGVNAGARFCMACGADVSGAQGEVATRMVASLSKTQQFKDGLLHALRDATLGEYEVLAELGAGGMATVFLAHDIHLDRKVAIKVMSPQLVSGDDMVERFKLEARTAAGLSHPHIIPIYAVKQQDELLYFVMKFVEGRPLDSIIKKEAPLPVPMVRQIVSRVADALGYAHRKGVVHRDIKPANIMIDTEGMPIVTDFGIAKVADKQGLTMTGATIGTPTYMSPEQCNAQPITGASDQYSLGVLAYEMLTGRALFDGESVMTIMFKHVHEEAPSLKTLNADCPPDLADAVMRMLSKRPEDRFPAMEEVVKVVAAPSLSFDDPMRTKLIELAMQGENRTVLQRVSTPRSPWPAVGKGTHQAELRVRTGPTTRPSQEPTEVLGTGAQAPKRRTGLLVGIAAVLVVGGGGALAVLQPWAAGSSTPAEPQTSPLVTQPVAPVAQAPPIDTSGSGSAGQPVDEAAAARPVQETPPPARTPPAQAQPPAPAPIRSVRIVDAPGQLSIGDRQPLRLTVTDAAGQNRSGADAAWSSDNPGVVSVADGVVRAVAPGMAVITARLGGRSDQVTISVAPEGVTEVTVSPTQVALEVGGGRQLSATVRGARGTLDRAVAWESSDPAVASVDADGRVQARRAGTAVITARSGGAAGQAQVTVAAVAPTDSELRAQVASAIEAYAQALESRNVDRVRAIYPAIPPAREQQLRDALPTMSDLDVNLNVASVTLSRDAATAVVRGTWRFRANGGGMQTLDANNTFLLELRGDRWVITDIR